MMTAKPPIPSQHKRLIRLQSALGENALIVRRATFAERLSAPFRYQLEVYSATHLTLEPADLIGTPVSISVVREDGQPPRIFHGYVTQLQRLGHSRAGTYAHYRLMVEPWLAFLSHISDCRIFQSTTVAEVLQTLFSSVSDAKYRLTLTQPHAQHVHGYWVQYNESALNFFHRLCAREGLAYYFVHHEHDHELHIVDDANSLPTLDPHVLKLQPGTVGHAHLNHWTRSARLVAGRHVQRSYNYALPRETLQSSASAGDEIGRLPRAPQLEHFHYSEDYDRVVDGREETRRRTQRRSEARFTRWEAKGDYRHIAAGGHFQVVPVPDHGHFTDQNKSFTVAELTLTADDDSGRCHCAFTSVPKGVLVQAESEVPHISGLQTAVVTGPPGSELHTDDLNRIKVQFHWDRYGKQDEHTSCWLRVMQPVAGPGFGGHFTPRVGQEVVVAFENGNPERPFVLGSLHHGEHAPPFPSQNGRRNGVKTRSTPGGGPGNFNALYFDDSRGSEELYVQAERDLNAKIKRNESRDVGEVLHVKAGQKILLEVGGSQIEITASGVKINGQAFVSVRGGKVSLN